jgi:hypothetical protein
MIKAKLIANSSEFVGKVVSLDLEDQDPITCTIDVMEEEGIIVHYFTEESDCSSIVDEDDEDVELTVSYFPWRKVTEIKYRKSESY